MIFKQYRNGSCDIEFSKEEINIIKKKKQLHLPPETLKHFSNTLIRIVGDWHAYFDESVGGWFLGGHHGLLNAFSQMKGTFFSDPFTALTEADKWYKETEL